MTTIRRKKQFKGQPFGEVLWNADRFKLVEVFKDVWEDIYQGKRPCTLKIRADILRAIDEMVDIWLKSKPPRKKYIFKGCSVDEDDSYHIYVVPINPNKHEKEDKITYSALGTDWKSQVHILFNPSEFRFSYTSVEELIARVLYELTFFGSSMEDIETRIK